MRPAFPRLAFPSGRVALLLPCLAALLAAGPTAALAAAAARPGADSILAVVTGPGAAPRPITRTQFARAWSQLRPPARPDSLTPDAARRFLDLLIGKETLSLMAERETWTWTSRERYGYEALRDQLVMGTALDSAFAVTRATAGPAADTLDRQALGLLTRDRAVERMGIVWDDSLLARLALAFAALPRPTADSSAAAQLRMLSAAPVVDPADTGRVLARSSEGDYRASDLLASWNRLNPVYRPRVTEAAQVRDLATNGLFERMLRRRAAASGIEQRADVVARLAAERERISVSHLVDRDVYARVPSDSLTLLRFYREHEPDWALPDRVQLLQVVLASRGAADDMALRLRDEVQADSLAMQARRTGARWLREVSAAEDSALYARAAGAGTRTVLGPTPVADGWEVIRVMALMPGRARSYEEAKGLVLKRWYDVEGERRMQELLGRARAAARVEVRAPALRRLVLDPPRSLQRTP